MQQYPLSAQLISIEQYLKASLSKSTQRAYKSDLNHFKQWGGVLPANKEMMLLYLNGYAGKLKFSTLSRKLKAISQWHNLHNALNPTQSVEVKQLMKGIRNTHGNKYKKAKALSLKDLKKIHKLLRDRNNPIDIRNIAMIMI